MKPVAIVLAGVLAALGFGYLAVTVFDRPDDPRGASPAALRDFSSERVSPGSYRIDSDLMPPTDRWFSSSVFGGGEDPIFPTPLAFRQTDRGYEVSYPRLRAESNTMSATPKADLLVRFDNDDWEVEGYDPLSVSFGNDLLETRVTRGSPFVWSEARRDTRLVVSATGTFDEVPGGFTTTVSGVTYGVSVQGGNVAREGTGRLQVAAKPGTVIATFLIADLAQTEAYFEASRHPIVKTDWQTELSGRVMRGTFQIDTEPESETIFGLLSHHYANREEVGTGLGSVKTLYGDQEMVRGNRFAYELAAPAPPPGLDLSKLTPGERTRLGAFVRQDLATTKFDGADSYAAGKQLYRAAWLAEIASGIDDTATARKLLDKLSAEFSRWCDPDKGSREQKYFYYDPGLRGLVAVKPAFGSQEFNDHHYHYGYFIKAASLAAARDPRIREACRDTVTFVAKDIANPDPDDTTFPYLRHFDPYSGHSWASGFGTYADGNNQESSSEAVNAWYAVHSWGMVTGQRSLADAGRILLAHEREAARRYWIRGGLDYPETSEYRHDTVSIVWGGKRDFATFFDARPEAAIGIQLLPVNPGTAYARADADRILAALRGELGTREPELFNDSFAMLRAEADPAGAARRLAELDDDQIDPSSSRSYVFAWIRLRD